jgi:hypothetical protein
VPGISKRHRLIEPIERGLRGVEQTLTACLIDHLFYKIGTRARLSGETLFGELNDHSLGPCRDETCRNLDKSLALPRCWYGYIFDYGFACFNILKKLFH